MNYTIYSNHKLIQFIQIKVCTILKDILLNKDIKYKYLFCV